MGSQKHPFPLLTEWPTLQHRQGVSNYPRGKKHGTGSGEELEKKQRHEESATGRAGVSQRDSSAREAQ